MPALFIPSELVPIPFTKKPGGQRIEGTDITSFWEIGGAKSYADARGIYVFCITTPNTTMPYYVGQASKTFAQEIFTVDKVEKYNSSLAEYARDFKPGMLFLIQEKQKGKPSQRALDELEKYLIMAGKERNPRLKNIQNTKEAQLFRIKGMEGGKGKPLQVTVKFRSIFNL